MKRHLVPCNRYKWSFDMALLVLLCFLQSCFAFTALSVAIISLTASLHFYMLSFPSESLDLARREVERLRQFRFLLTMTGRSSFSWLSDVCHMRLNKGHKVRECAGKYIIKGITSYKVQNVCVLWVSECELWFHDCAVSLLSNSSKAGCAHYSLIKTSKPWQCTQLPEKRLQGLFSPF